MYYYYQKYAVSLLLVYFSDYQLKNSVFKLETELTFSAKIDSGEFHSSMDSVPKDQTAVATGWVTISFHSGNKYVDIVQRGM